MIKLKQKAMTPISIKKAIEEARAKRDELKNEISQKRTFIQMSPEEFAKLMAAKCERIFLQRSEPRRFDFDINNKAIIKELYLYAAGDKEFKGSLLKGIHLWGDFGTGKTSLLQALSEIISETTYKNIEIIYAKEFATKLIEKGLNYYAKKPLFIDDVGREQAEINYYGNITRPVSDLYYLRKENGAWTLQTCQYPIAKLEEKYGKFTTDRMRAAFNEIELKGKSRRI
jgi:DNA replication protein DnaC